MNMTNYSIKIYNATEPLITKFYQANANFSNINYTHEECKSLCFNQVEVAFTPIMRNMVIAIIVFMLAFNLILIIPMDTEKRMMLINIVNLLGTITTLMFIFMLIF